VIPLRPLPGRDSPEYRELLLRGQGTRDSIPDAVAETVRLVRSGGDAALLELTERFDRVRLQGSRIPTADCEAALEALDPRLLFTLARANHEIALRVALIYGVASLAFAASAGTAGVIIPFGGFIIAIGLPAVYSTLVPSFAAFRVEPEPNQVPA